MDELKKITKSVLNVLSEAIFTHTYKPIRITFNLSLESTDWDWAKFKPEEFVKGELEASLIEWLKEIVREKEIVDYINYEYINETLSIEDLQEKVKLLEAKFDLLQQLFYIYSEYADQMEITEEDDKSFNDLWDKLRVLEKQVENTSA